MPKPLPAFVLSSYKLLSQQCGQSMLLKFELDAAHMCQNGLNKLHCDILTPLIFSGFLSITKFYFLFMFYVSCARLRIFHHRHRSKETEQPPSWTWSLCWRERRECFRAGVGNFQPAGHIRRFPRFIWSVLIKATAGGDSTFSKSKSCFQGT